LLCLLALVSPATAQPSGTSGPSSDPAQKTDPAPAPDSASKADPAKADGDKADSAKKPTESEAASAVAQTRDDAVLDRAQPDFTIVNLPTTLRLPQWKSAFRVTHRFTRSLGEGDFGDLLEDFFGFDAGALIGLEFRFGILPGTQVGILRTSDRTIQFFGQYDIKSQSDAFPLGLAAYATIDGTNNFRDSYSPGIGVIVSRTIGTHAAVYVQPMYVNNTNPLPDELIEDNDTFLLGVGARVRIRPTVYVVGEFIPRVGGYDPGVHGASFGVEKRAGGHSFQINFSNSFGTTMAQAARGGLSNDDWYIGFNITRKFF
jgi:hypothetical protein